MRLMLSASAFSSWSCCVLSEPGGEGGAGGSGTASSIASGFSASGTSLDAELAPLFFPFFEKSPKNAARGARATCSPALRPHEIFMQGIGAARDERIRVASATRDEALGVLTRKPPPYTRRTSSSAFSRTARLIDTLVFGSSKHSSARPRFRTPPFRPRATCPRCHVRRSPRRGRASARGDHRRDGRRACTPPAFLTGNRPKRTPKRRRRRGNTRPRRHRASSSCRASRGSPSRRRRRRPRRGSRATRSARTSRDRRAISLLRFPTRRGRRDRRNRQNRRKFRSPRRRPSPRSRSRTSRPPTRPGGSRRRRRATRESLLSTGFGKRRKRGRKAAARSGTRGAFPASATRPSERARKTDVKTLKR